jgi:tRNA (mo5U34)-methyltransferase
LFGFTAACRPWSPYALCDSGRWRGGGGVELDAQARVALLAWGSPGVGAVRLSNVRPSREREPGADALLTQADPVEPVEPIPETSAAERVVADVLAIGASVVDAERVRASVALWFHTFALAPGVYTPGIARDHGYRLAVLGADRFAGRSVLDVGTFDGFYSFLAEVRGARRVVAVDNEQYVDCVRARFGVTLAGGVGFRAIAGLVASRVEYRRMDALDAGELGERFDVVLCFGVLHRVTNPIALLQALADVLAPGGEIVLETYGSRLDADAAAIEVHEPGDVYARDDFVYWGFSPEGLRRLGRIVGLDELEVVDQLEIDGHPRILALLRAAS